MQLIHPSVEILTPIDAPAMLRRIEYAARTCYASHHLTKDGSAEELIRSLISRGHFSVLEHESVSFKIITDRGVMAEVTRHRHNSFSVQSTRYVNYGKRGMKFIIPPWCKIEVGDYTSLENDDNNIGDLMSGVDGHTICNSDSMWFLGRLFDEFEYNRLLKQGWKPEQARAALSNSLATELVTTANLRQWREVLKQRTARAAHPQMRQVANMIYDQLVAAGLGVIFEDITPFRD